MNVIRPAQGAGRGLATAAVDAPADHNLWERLETD
jgi:hypothetical protein